MYSNVYSLLKIKPSEYKVVRQLFLVQFFLGIATAFLFTSTLTLFLHAFEVQQLPKVYLLSALLLLVANFFYGKLEHAFTSRRLLQVIIIFSTGSLVLTWAGIMFFSYTWLPFVLAAWNMVVYMLVGYAFWGMAAIIFNVRESKRIFSVVGSGDIPAKLLGYALVPVLIPYIGVENLLWLSVLAFVSAYFFLLRFQHQAIDSPVQQHHQHQGEEVKTGAPAGNSFVAYFFHNRLIFFIALFSFLAFTIYALIDYTLLVEIKSRFTRSPDLAVFIGVFFASGRVLAIFFKLLFSSRVISRLGLANSLLLSPLLLLLLTGILLLPGESELAILYIFGVMVLLSEVLKSAVQEPAFFVLFQPLQPNIRLKGHLVAKGYMLPFALLGSGLFLLFTERSLGGISILFIAQVLVVLIMVWIASVYLVKKEYLRTLVQAIRRGWFTGTELFLNDAPVRQLLLRKTASKNPKKVIMALELLERSGYTKYRELLLEQFYSSFTEVRRFVLASLIHLEMKEALPLVKQQLQTQPDNELKPQLLKAYFYLVPAVAPADEEALNTLHNEALKAAFVGLLMRNDAAAHQVVFGALEKLINGSSNPQDQHLVLDTLSEAPYRGGQQLLETLLAASSETLCKRAIETVGKLREFALVGQVVQIASARKAYHALQKSLVLFGDEVFGLPALRDAAVPAGALRAVVLAAGKVKGDNSTQYLMELLQHNPAAADDVVEALWLKQATPDNAEKKLLEKWLAGKLAACRRKLIACRTVKASPGLQLLSDALTQEIKQDLQKLLKGFALCYNRQRIDRVQKLLQLGDPARVANAIEILEHMIPKRFFLQADHLLEFVMDAPVEKGKRPTKAKTAAAVGAILQDEHMHCSSWTKSVACYLIPEVNAPVLWKLISTQDNLPQDPVFQETKHHVLSELT